MFDYLNSFDPADDLDTAGLLSAPDRAWLESITGRVWQIDAVHQYTHCHFEDAESCNPQWRWCRVYEMPNGTVIHVAGEP